MEKGVVPARHPRISIASETKQNLVPDDRDLNSVRIISRSGGLLKDGEAVKSRINQSVVLGSYHQCLVCEDVYGTAIKLKMHLLVEHVGLIYHCRLCGLLFENETDKKQHTNLIHASIKCSFCWENLNETDESHYETHDAVSCFFCNSIVHPKSEFSKHLTENHMVELDFAKSGDFTSFYQVDSKANESCKLCGKIKFRDTVAHYIHYHKINAYALAEILIENGMKIRNTKIKVTAIKGRKLKRLEEKCSICNGEINSVTEKLHEIFCNGLLYCSHCDITHKKPIKHKCRSSSTSDECQFCDEISNPEHLKTHDIPLNYSLSNLIIQQDDLLFCSVCDASCTHLNNIYSHLIETHGFSARKILKNIKRLGEENLQHIRFEVDFDPKLIRVLFDERKTNVPGQCELCELNFVNQVELLDHLNSQHGLKIKFWCTTCDECHINRHLINCLKTEFTCVKCDSTLSFEQGREHVIREHEANLLEFNLKDIGLSCRFCNTYFWHSNELDKHEFEVHFDSNPNDFFKCFNCDRTFSSVKALSEHDYMCYFSELIYQCVECGVVSGTIEDARTHLIAYHHETEVLFCPETECRLSFPKIKFAKAHYFRMHVVPKSEKFFMCSICGASFATQKSYLLHYNSHAKGVTCVHCGEKFISLDLRKLHYTTVHTGESIYLNRIPLSMQMKEDTNFECSYCGKTYNRKETFREHLLIHVGPKHQCPHCPKEFTQQSNLRRHVRLHTGEKPYKCPHCPKRFSDKGACNSHTNVHTQKGGCFCSECGKKFSKPAKLKYHMRIHTGEGLFKCDHCPKHFTDSYYLRMHLECHDPSPATFFCHCGKAFKNERALRDHQNNMHADPLGRKRRKPSFKCLHCGVIYSARKIIINHIKKQHGIETNHVFDVDFTKVTKTSSESDKAADIKMDIGETTVQVQRIEENKELLKKIKKETQINDETNEEIQVPEFIDVQAIKTERFKSEQTS